MINRCRLLIAFFTFNTLQPHVFTEKLFKLHPHWLDILFFCLIDRSASELMVPSQTSSNTGTTQSFGAFVPLFQFHVVMTGVLHNTVQ